MTSKLCYSLFFLLVIFDVCAQNQSIVEVKINHEKRQQTIQNFGASGCWYAEPIGKNWPLAKKEQLAELLFSTDTLPDGSPKGIGLTAWRFNIGAGTAEQGDSSGIIKPNHRVECFVDANGQYNWDKQIGYQWFLQKAKAYNVPDLIAFVNSPPVFYNQNKLGFLLTNGSTTNLHHDRYPDFANFLSTVLAHFAQQGYPFKYISPINEPQWAWDAEFGKAKQEGSPYTNAEIYNVVTMLDKSLTEDSLTTKILIPEAAMLNHLTDSNVVTSDQIERFWNPQSALYLGNCSHLAPVAAAHSYFSDVGNPDIISFREKVAAKTAKYNLEYWQSEYCLLGNGYKEEAQSRTTLDCGLFLAKIIHHDLTIGNATAWHYWNSFEPGDWHNDTRYYLFAIQPNADWTDGEFYITGNFLALGHYSRFIRPGMQRVEIERSDNLTDLELASGLMISAFIDPKTNKLVVVAINYSDADRTINLQTQHKGFKQYITNHQNQLKCNGKVAAQGIKLMRRSIYTFVSE